MASSIAVEKSRRTKKARKSQDAEMPGPSEVELGGKKIQIEQQTVQTGVVPMPHFLRRFLD